MHVLRRNPWLPALGVLLAVLVVYGARARADVTTDQPGSIIIFPKVISNGTLDTTIQITNTDNMAHQAQCYYINASGTCSSSGGFCIINGDCPSGETCSRSCTETDFPVPFTKQQPVGWQASSGGVNPVTLDTILGAGTAFGGELKCIVIGPDGAPTVANVLKGEATITSAAGGTESVYNAIAIQATNPSSSPPSNDPYDFALPLNNTQYNACPASLIMNYRPDGTYTFFGTDVTIANELTLVPCTEDITDLVLGGTPSRALFTITNEFEQTVTTSVTFDCWLDDTLADLIPAISTEFANVTITPPSSSVCLTGDLVGQPCTVPAGGPDPCTGAVPRGGVLLGCLPWTGLLGVAEQIQTSTGGTTREAYNLHVIGTRPGDIIIAPIDAVPGP